MRYRLGTIEGRLDVLESTPDSVSGATDHGALTGLSDDDHTQYHNDTRGDARYTQIGHAHDAADVVYDNTSSGLAATDVQAAIDELAASGGGGGGSDRSAVTALSISSGTVTVDCDDGDYFTLALNANVTSWTFNNLPAAGVGMRLLIAITQDTTARTVAWPATFAWNVGSPESISAAVSSRNILVIETVDEGDTWVAALRNDMTRVDELPEFTPGDVFTGGGKGFWWEFDDYATMFQLSTATVDVAADGDPVGYVEDLSGNDNHAVNTAGGIYRPVAATDSTYKCLAFDGANDWIKTLLTAADLSSSMTMFVTLRSSDVQSLIGYTTSGGGSYFGCAQSGNPGAATEGSSGTLSYYVDGAAVTANRAAYFTAAHDDSWHVLEIRGLNFSGWTGYEVTMFGYSGYEFAGKVNAVFLCDTPSDEMHDQLRTYFGARVGLSI